MKHSILRYTRYRKLNFIFICVSFFFFLSYSINHRYHISIDQEYTNLNSPHLQPNFVDHVDNLSLDQIINANITVSQISVHRCLKLFTCQPFANDDNWLKYKSPLNLYTDLSLFKPLLWFNYHLYIQYHQLHHLNRVLADVQIIPLDSDPKLKSNHANGEWSKTPIFNKFQICHYYITPNSNDDLKSIQIIHDVDVLFGGNDLTDDRPYWNYQSKSINLPILNPNTINPHLSLLKFNQLESNQILTDLNLFQYYKDHHVMLAHNQNFKVIQLSDLHFGQDTGKCILQSSNHHCKSDFRTIKFVEAAIHHEQPDLIVITGDLIDAKRTKHFKSVILKALGPILKLKIPFIFTFGESDFHELNSKLQILKFLTSLPYCFNQLDNTNNLHGLSNNNLNIYYAEDIDKFINDNIEAAVPLSIITVLDSHDRKIDVLQINYLYRINGQLSKVSKRNVLAKRIDQSSVNEVDEPSNIDDDNKLPDQKDKANKQSDKESKKTNNEPDKQPQPKQSNSEEQQQPDNDQPKQSNNEDSKSNQSDKESNQSSNVESKSNEQPASEPVNESDKQAEQPINEVNEQPANKESDQQESNQVDDQQMSNSDQQSNTNSESDQQSNTNSESDQQVNTNSESDQQSNTNSESDQQANTNSESDQKANNQVNHDDIISSEAMSRPQDTHKLLFFHYPLPNFRPKGKFKLIGGYNMKNPLNSKSDALLKDEIINCGYHVISVGHEHENDACIQSYRDLSKSEAVKTPVDAIAESDDYIWLCYNSITGDSGDTHLDDDYERKLRVFHIDANVRKLMSWKVRESDSNGFDYQIIKDFN